MFVSFPAQGWGEERITVMQSLWSKGGKKDKQLVFCGQKSLNNNYNSSTS